MPSERENAQAKAPSEKENAQAKAPGESKTQPQASTKASAALQRRIRSVQPKLDAIEQGAVQPQKQDEATATATKPTSKPRTRTPAKKEAPDALAQPPLAAREGSAPEKEASVKEDPVLALQEPQVALPVQAPTGRGIEVAMPPVFIPALRGERRQFWGRVLLLLLVGALLALSVLIFTHRPTRYSSYSHSIVFLYHPDSDTTQVLYDGESCKEGIVGKCVRSERDSSGSVCAALIGDTLYLVQGDEVVQIGASVLDFALSQNGRALAYRTADQTLYYVQAGRKPQTSTVSADTRDECYCLSPDGELLFYTYARQSDDGEVKTHADVFSLSGDKPFFYNTTHILPVAIADGYEHVFYFNDAGDLYYMNDEGEISLCRRKGEGEMELLFDREFEEVLIKDAGGVALWQDGELTVIARLKGAENLTLLANKLAVYRTLPNATQCLVRSFDENYYLKTGTDAQGVELVYLDGDELQGVAFVDEHESRIVVTDKGVYYLEREVMADEVRKHLYRCPWGQTEPVRLSWDVEDFLTNSDGSRLLHADHRGALYTSRIVGDALDAQRVSDILQAGSLRVTSSDAFYYYVQDVPYTSDNGKTPVALTQHASAVYTDVHTAFFFVAEPTHADGSVTYTVYTNHRNRRESVRVAESVTLLS